VVTEGARVPDTTSLTGSVALVTGAGSGIGEGIAVELARSGARIVLTGRRAGRLDQVRERIESAGGTAFALPWDVGRGDDAADLVAAASSRAGADVSVLAHAAGNQIRKPATEMTLEDFDSVTGLHLRAAFALSQAVARPLITSGHPGSMLYVASLTSARAGLSGTVAYGAAKSGLLGVMRTLAVEWAEYGIRVNAVAVGFVSTEMTRDIDGTPARLAITGRAPMGRLGTPEEIGRAAAFLASGQASFITGECLTVDGGWSVA
jgi:NAD(P)-dependent dehydrogenase (short-subunit alcohol dehydrogenase family)